MAEHFQGPVVIDGELQVPGPVRPEPAAQFGSHVGVEGNLDVAGLVHIRGGTVMLQNGASIRVDGPVRPEPAAQFGSHVGVEGNLDVGGIIRLLNGGDIQLFNGDCAEEFDVHDDVPVPINPGTVVVLAPDGSLRPSTTPYDQRVAGVVSGAGNYRPAMILDRRDTGASRVAVALTGKVACHVDARYGAVVAGDLLTTSGTPGHAMRADDRSRLAGSLIGKAIGSLASGQGLVPALVSLQ